MRRLIPTSDEESALESAINHLEKKYAELLSDFSHMQTDYQKMSRVLGRLDKITLTHLRTMEKQMDLIENLDGTLRNVLLAIKQNEYLQAWYPEQKEHPEMKVVGHHPESAYAKSKVKEE